jgi:hypothetical protein
VKRLVIGLSTAALAALVVSLVLVLGGSSGPSAGPLAFAGGGQTPINTCLPDRIETVTGDSIWRSQQPITIERVQLEDDNHLRLLAAELVPITGTGTIIGAAAGFPPPPGERPQGFEWNERQHPPAHLRAGEPFLLVFGLERTAKIGRSGAAEISYEVAGQQYRWRDPVTFVLRPVC